MTMLLRAGVVLSVAATLFAQPGRVDLLFLLDTSQSMFRPDRFIASGARLAAYELGPGDRVALMSFAGGSKLHSDFTADPGKIDAAFRKATSATVRWGASRRVYDGIFAAVEVFPRVAAPNEKRIVAVITNDVDRDSRHSPEEVIREAKVRGVAVWAFLIANPYPHPPQVPITYPRIPYPDVEIAADLLRPLADGTGGRVSIRDMSGYMLRQAIAACKGNGQ